MIRLNYFIQFNQLIWQYLVICYFPMNLHVHPLVGRSVLSSKALVNFFFLFMFTLSYFIFEAEARDRNLVIQWKKDTPARWEKREYFDYVDLFIKFIFFRLFHAYRTNCTSRKQKHLNKIHTCICQEQDNGFTNMTKSKSVSSGLHFIATVKTLQ